MSILTFFNFFFNFKEEYFNFDYVIDNTNKPSKY